MQDVNKIVDELIEEKGLGKLDGDKKALLRENLAEQLTGRINEAIMYRLPEESYKEFQEIVTAEELDEGRLENVVRGSGLDLAKIVNGVIERFRKAFLDLEIAGTKGKAVA